MIRNYYTLGAAGPTTGQVSRFYGTTNEEMFGRVSKKIATDVEDRGDRLTIRDADKTPGLQVGFKRTADGTSFLSVKNSDKTEEFITETRIEIPVADAELSRAGDLAGNFTVVGVTVQPAERATLISLQDQGYRGQRCVRVEPNGRIRFFLREA